MLAGHDHSSPSTPPPQRYHRLQADNLDVYRHDDYELFGIHSYREDPTHNHTLSNKQNENMVTQGVSRSKKSTSPVFSFQKRTKNSKAKSKDQKLEKRATEKQLTKQRSVSKSRLSLAYTSGLSCEGSTNQKQKLRPSKTRNLENEQYGNFECVESSRNVKRAQRSRAQRSCSQDVRIHEQPLGLGTPLPIFWKPKKSSPPFPLIRLVGQGC